MIRYFLLSALILLPPPAISQVASQRERNQKPTADCRNPTANDTIDKRVISGCAVDGAIEPEAQTGSFQTTIVGDNAFTFDKGLQIGGGKTANGALGTMLRTDGHRDWVTLMPKPDPDANNTVEAVEFAINGGTPFTFTASGSTVTTSTTLPASAAGGRLILEESVYSIKSVSGTKVVVTGTPPAKGIGIYASTRGSGIASVSGNIVTRVSGDPFVPHHFGNFSLKINGTPYMVTATDFYGQKYTLASTPGKSSSASYAWQTTMNDQISTLRVARVWGAHEENISLYAAPDGYHLRSLLGSAPSKYRPLFIGSGERTPGDLARQISVYANGDLLLGGTYGNEAMRIVNSVRAVSRWETQAAVSGLPVSLRARSDSQSDVDASIDMQGSGGLSITNGAFSRAIVKFNAHSASTDYPEISAGAGQVDFSVNGRSNSIDIAISPKNGAMRPASDNGAALGSATARWSSTYATRYCYAATLCDWAGKGSPEGVVVAAVGSTYRRTDGGAGSSFYVKESGSSHTGWVAK